jgi:hypothetical protein
MSPRATPCFGRSACWRRQPSASHGADCVSGGSEAPRGRNRVRATPPGALPNRSRACKGGSDKRPRAGERLGERLDAASPELLREGRRGFAGASPSPGRDSEDSHPAAELQQRLAVRDSNPASHGILEALTATRMGRALSRATTQVYSLRVSRKGNAGSRRAPPIRLARPGEQRVLHHLHEHLGDRPGGDAADLPSLFSGERIMNTFRNLEACLWPTNSPSSRFMDESRPGLRAIAVRSPVSPCEIRSAAWTWRARTTRCSSDRWSLVGRPGRPAPGWPCRGALLCQIAYRALPMPRAKPTSSSSGCAASSRSSRSASEGTCSHAPEARRPRKNSSAGMPDTAPSRGGAARRGRSRFPLPTQAKRSRISRRARKRRESPRDCRAPPSRTGAEAAEYVQALTVDAQMLGVPQGPVCSSIWDPSPLPARSAVRPGEHPIFPELRKLVTDAEVLEASDLARPGVAAGALAEALARRRHELPAWRARYAIAWLLKHGLQSSCGGCSETWDSGHRESFDRLRAGGVEGPSTPLR